MEQLKAVVFTPDNILPPQVWMIRHFCPVLVWYGNGDHGHIEYKLVAIPENTTLEQFSKFVGRDVKDAYHANKIKRRTAIIKTGDSIYYRRRTDNLSHTEPYINVMKDCIENLR